MVDDLYPVVHPWGYQALQLLLALGAVGAQRHKEGDVFIPNTALIEIVNKQRAEHILLHPEAGNIADDDGDLVPWRQHFLKLGTANRVFHRCKKGLGDVPKGRERPRIQCLDIACKG